MFEYVSRLGSCRFFAGTISDEFHAEHQTHAAHLSDQRLPLLQLAQTTFKILPDHSSILLDIVAVNYFQGRQALGHGYRVAAKSIEMQAVGYRLGDFRIRDTGPQRRPI